MSYKLFVTGTDTGIGKTYVSVGLLNAFRSHGMTAIGIKPVASGGFLKNDHLYSQDALDLIHASSTQIDYHHANPFVFEPAIAPHLAAQQVNRSLSLRHLIKKTQPGFNYPCDIHVIEGVGGWFTPLNQHETMADFVSYFKMNTLLVVGMRLGCINHALLTFHAIKRSNLPFVGWIANCFEKNESTWNEEIDFLQNWLDIPYIGRLSHKDNPAEYLNIRTLLHPKNNKK